MRLRDYLPRGLYWRTALIIIVPAALLQLIITLVFLDDHWRFQSKRMSQAVAADVTLLLQTYEANPTPETLAYVQRIGRAPLRLAIDFDTARTWSASDAAGVRAHSTSTAICSNHWTTNSAARSGTIRPAATAQVYLRVPTTDGVFEFRTDRDRVQARSGPLFVMWIIGGTVFFCLVSILFVRGQVRPIEKLADAMEQFGRGDDSDTFRVRGAREVRSATRAFFNMRERVQAANGAARAIVGRRQPRSAHAGDAAEAATRADAAIARKSKRPSAISPTWRRRWRNISPSPKGSAKKRRRWSTSAPWPQKSWRIRHARGADIAVEQSGQVAAPGRGARAEAVPRQPDRQRRRAWGQSARHCEGRRERRDGFASTTTAPAFLRNCTKKRSGRSRGSMRRALAIRKASALASPSPAMSRAATAAIFS